MFITSEIGYHFLPRPRVLLGANILYLNMGENQLMNTGVNVYYVLNETPSNEIVPAWIKVGTHYRLDNAVVGMFGFGNGHYKLMFSYDLGISPLSDTGVAYNAYEVTLAIKFIKLKHAEDNPYKNTHDPRI